jgi:hypothetical protein
VKKVSNMQQQQPLYKYTIAFGGSGRTLHEARRAKYSM